MPRDRLRNDRGSALMLVPAGVLVVLMLAGIVIDSAVVYLAEREAASTATAVANDAASLAVDASELRDGGDPVVDPERLAKLAPELRAIAASQLSDALVAGSVEVSLRQLDATSIEVVIRGEAVRVIGPFAELAPRIVEARAVGRLT